MRAAGTVTARGPARRLVRATRAGLVAIARSVSFGLQDDERMYDNNDGKYTSINSCILAAVAALCSTCQSLSLEPSTGRGKLGIGYDFRVLEESICDVQDASCAAMLRD